MSTKLSKKLERINASMARIREKTNLPNAVIENVATAVEGMSVINNQNKDITANGTYSAEEGYTGLGTINVSVPTGGTPAKSNIYRVQTLEERNNITDMVEGDMCVVYSSNMSNATVESRFRTATFPDTVVLGTAITDYIDVRYRAVDSSIMFDCMGQLDSSRFRMDCFTDNSSIRIQYTSEDGITYTRTDTTGNPVDFGTEIYYEMADMWNDAIGYFIQVGDRTFDGLFEYKDSTWNYSKININTTHEYIYTGKKVYTDNGTITGTITENPSVEFDDVDSKIYTELLKKYDNMDKIVVPEDATEYFANKKLYVIPTKIDGKPLLDTSNTTNMYKMFNGCTSLTVMPKLDTSNVTDMRSMFYYCPLLVSIPQLNTSKVTTMNSMFHDCWALTSIPQLDTSKVTDMGSMFVNCWALISIPELDTSNVTTMNGMFLNCNVLESVPHLDTSKVTNMYGMFNSCRKLVSIPQLDTSNVTTMNGMFNSCWELTTVPQLNTGNVTDMGSMFNGCKALITIPLINTNNVTNMNTMFANCSSLTSIPQLDTSKVTDMEYMFNGCTSLTTIPQLNTSSVTNMDNMFNGCTSLTSIPLINTGSVTDTDNMFKGCTSLISIPQLDMSRGFNMSYMFANCTELTTIPLINITRADNMNGMFEGCTSLTSIPQLNTSTVRWMERMFNGCTSLTTVPQLDTSKLQYVKNMFKDCPNLTDESLNNILAMAKNSKVSSYNKTTTNLGLNTEQKERIKSLSNYSAFIAAGWKNN